MAISTYSELKTAVANWINRTNLTSYVPDFIALGEARVYRECARIRGTETAVNSVIASGVIAVPTDYHSMKHLYIDNTPVQFLKRKTAAWIYENYPVRSSDNMPKYFAEDAGNIIFGPYPDSDYTVKGTYYKRLPALSDSNTTNWFLTNAPGLILFASLEEAEPFMKNDDRIELWQGKYGQLKQALLDEEATEQFSGGPLEMSASWG